MKVLLLNQVFHPDVVAVAQYLSDLSVGLSEANHEVTVICSDHGYDNPKQRFPRREIWKGVRIRRVPVLGLGKKSKIGRIIAYASFFVSSFAALLGMTRQDVVVVTPPPPLLSVMAAAFVRLRGGRLLYWSMDLNPDEAIAAGWMKADSLSAKMLCWALRVSLDASYAIVVLDRFMKDRIVAKGIPAEKIHIIPPWAQDQVAFFDPEGRDSLRREIKVAEKFVVMYSGNHSPLHPLDTLLQSALRLRGNPGIAFVFVGGGSHFGGVKSFARDNDLTNVICLTYRPLNELAASLSAADLQVVLLGNQFIGIVHPCKIYNILAVGSPFLYIGPTESHVADLGEDSDVAQMANFACHGEVDRVTGIIETMAKAARERPGRPALLDRLSRKVLMSSMIALIECAGSASETHAGVTGSGYPARPAARTFPDAVDR
jgi:glycosyltransferase involved in cell wall biosynthesis